MIIEFYKQREDFWIYYSGSKHSKGCIFMVIKEYETQDISFAKVYKLSTPKLSGNGGGYGWLLNEMIKVRHVLEVDIYECKCKFIFPHLTKHNKKLFEKYNIHFKENPLYPTYKKFIKNLDYQN